MIPNLDFDHDQVGIENASREFVACFFFPAMWVLIAIAVVLVALVLPLWMNKRNDGLEQLLLTHKDISIVFAHPDDEVMFFLPLILLAQELGVKVRLLCMSTGNYDGLGDVRVKEFRNVAKQLGVASADILDDVRLPDGPSMWLSADVSIAMESYFGGHPSIKAVFTFDPYGVSGHPNHRSVHQGLAEWRRSKTNRNVSIHTLDSVSIWRKYIPLVDILFVVFWDYASLVTVNVKSPFRSLELMKLYGSQNVWFRKLFSFFSRYSYVNQFHPLL